MKKKYKVLKGYGVVLLCDLRHDVQIHGHNPSLGTIRNWVKALKLDTFQAACTDGHRRTAISLADAKIFLARFREWQAFKVVK